MKQTPFMFNIFLYVTFDVLKFYEKKMFGRLKNIFETYQIICNMKNNLEYYFIL